MSRILLVEDEEITREGIKEYLTAKGYEIRVAADGEEGLGIFQEEDFDVVLLDIMLPKKDGLEVLATIRKESTTPVLMLTALGDENTQLASFDEEADDYMTKPFSLAILEKRIEALLRRNQARSGSSLWTYGEARVDFAGFSASYEDQPIDIKPKEVRLLKLLVEHEGQVLSRSQIIDRLWDQDEYPLDRVIDVYVKNLRKKLRLDCIKTVKGIGYKYEE